MVAVWSAAKYCLRMVEADCVVAAAYGSPMVDLDITGYFRWLHWLWVVRATVVYAFVR